MKKFILFLLLCLCLPGLAWAFYGSSNLGGLGYPDPRCRKPYSPYSNDQYAWDNFRREVDEYGRCIEDYVEAAENDRADILQKANTAVREYNNFIQALR